MTRQSRILEEVAGWPSGQVQEELESVQHEIDKTRTAVELEQRELARLQHLEQILAQVLRFHQWRDSGVPGAADTLAALSANELVAKEQSISANVRTIVRNSTTPLRPGDVQEELLKFGIEADGSTIRMALRRAVEQGVLTKVGTRYQRVDAQV